MQSSYCSRSDEIEGTCSGSGFVSGRGLGGVDVREGGGERR
jgi:hypothetical protein